MEKGKSRDRSANVERENSRGNGERRYAGSSHHERLEDRRRRLIGAAIGVYGTVGFRAATVRAVCEQAGLTPRYFYESFASNEVLLCDACGEAMEHMRMLALQAVQACEPTPAARIQAAARSYFAAILSNPAVARVTLIEIEGVSTYVDERYGAELDKTTALIERLVFADLAVGKNATLHPRMLARALLGSLSQLAKDWTHSGFVEPIDVLVFHFRAMALGALQQLRTSV